MKRLACALLIVLTMSSVTCTKDSVHCHHRIYFHNLSSKDVYVRLDAYQTKGELDSSFYLSTLNNANTYKVVRQAKSEKGLLIKGCIEDRFASIRPISKAYVYVLDADKLENTDIGTLIADQYYLKKYELSLDDLKQMNWEINFRD